VRKRPPCRPTSIPSPVVTTTTRAKKESSRPHSTGPISSVTIVIGKDTRGRVVPQLAEQYLLASLEVKRGTQR